MRKFKWQLIDSLKDDSIKQLDSFKDLYNYVLRLKVIATIAIIKIRSSKNKNKTHTHTQMK